MSEEFKFDAMAKAMNKLPEVKWDRCVSLPEQDYCVAFGWIARPDGKSDFMALYSYAGNLWFTTSSARYSKEFSCRLFGGNGEGHKDCQRVEDVFGDRVTFKVVRKKK